MNKIKYLVTNGGEGSICIAGRQRLEIPGKCKDLPLVLPENTARQTISRLKQRYPLLKIREANEDKAADTPPAFEPEKSNATAGSGNNLPATASGEPGNDKNSANSAKNADATAGSEAAGDKNAPLHNTTQTPAPTQKADNKKGK